MEWNFTLLHRVIVSKVFQVTIKRTAAVNLSYKLITNMVPEPKDIPILLFHDLLSSKKHWSDIGKIIGTMVKQPVLVVDLRNHGNSPHTMSHKYTGLAEDILALLDKLSITKATLIGHSMGGSAAMCTSLVAPERVAGLLVIDISPISTSDQFLNHFGKLLIALKTISVKRPRTLYKTKKAVKKQLKHIIDDEVAIKEILYNLDDLPDGSIGWKFNLDSLIKNFYNIARFPKHKVKGKTYMGPTLFIGGQLSEYLPPDDLPGIREMFPQAVITYIPGCGHNVHLDDPRTFLEFTIAFVRTTIR